MPSELLTAALGAVRKAATADWSSVGDDSLLGIFQEVQMMSAVVRAIEMTVIREVDGRHLTSKRHGVDTAEWWQAQGGVGGRAARIGLRHARELAGFPLVAAALAAGTITGEQSSAMLSGLVRLPVDAPAEAVTDAQRHLLNRARELDVASLRRAAATVVDVVLPDEAEQSTAEALEERQRRARHDRFFAYGRDEAEGILWFRGRVPIADGEQLMEAVSTLARKGWRSEAATRIADRGSGADAEPSSTMSQLRADALVELAARGSGTTKQARFTVLVSIDQLRSELGRGVLAESGEDIAPSELRRLACDASVLPAVMGGPSEVLDLGRERRLVSQELRHVLVIRDRGCVFPGCDRPPADCEAHHIVPWVRGGPTSIENLVLLCPHHHRMIEPHPRSVPGSRWQLQMADDGVAEVLPPDRVDADRRPRRHTRFNLHGPPTTQTGAIQVA